MLPETELVQMPDWDAPRARPSQPPVSTEGFDLTYQHGFRPRRAVASSKDGECRYGVRSGFGPRRPSSDTTGHHPAGQSAFVAHRGSDP